MDEFNKCACGGDNQKQNPATKLPEWIAFLSRDYCLPVKEARHPFEMGRYVNIYREIGTDPDCAKWDVNIRFQGELKTNAETAKRIVEAGVRAMLEEEEKIKNGK